MFPQVSLPCPVLPSPAGAWDHFPKQAASPRNPLPFSRLHESGYVYGSFVQLGSRRLEVLAASRCFCAASKPTTRACPRGRAQHAAVCRAARGGPCSAAGPRPALLLALAGLLLQPLHGEQAGSPGSAEATSFAFFHLPLPRTAL